MYTGNRCALSSVRNIRHSMKDANGLDNDIALDIEAQLEMIEEEVIQLRTYINDNIKNNNLPVDTVTKV